MPKRTRAGALTALAGAALVAGTALAAPAAAAPKAPGFLTAADLPPRAGTSWTAGKVTAGIPEEVKQDICIGVGLGGGQDSWYRKFRTDLDTSARQVSAELPSVRLAKGRFAKLDEDIVSCADRIEMADPQMRATFQDHGTLPVGDGAHVYALRTVTAWGTSDIRLISIGREGRTVTVVDWGQLGGFVDAPVKAFKKTTSTAVRKLH
ncbi:MAG: hypothetical protein JF597_02630 [Streptomyces sp.]|uniref:hypothetical protein n=1 Tax=Streptomyces sp. TaxID=1931 RepID=UPI0025D1FE00|nr:hypothetical protein [Streptomyces sp.]MBW8792516.1 hypothetical protein [Streptomyces sp.]